MEIIQEIGSYAGFAAVVGLAVLSALYFSQARDVRRLREWAGRSPERPGEGAAPPATGQRVVARPVPRPPGQQTTSGRPVPGELPGREPPPVPRPAGGAAAAAAAGAGTAVATGPVTPAAARAAGTQEAGPAGDEPGAVSQDTMAHPAPVPPDRDGEEPEQDRDAPEPPTGATALPGAGAGAADDVDGEHDEQPAGEDVEHEGDDDGRLDDDDDDDEQHDDEQHDDEQHYDDDEDYYDEDDYDDEDAPETGDRPVPTLPPLAPRAPVARQPAAAARGSSILPPYEQSRPGGPPPGRFSGRGRTIALVIGGLLALALIAFGVTQLLEGGDATPATDQQAGSAGGGESPAGEEGGGAAEAQPAVDPSQVTVAVLNGTTTSGLAADLGETVEAEGYRLGMVTNGADRARAESVVLFAPGARREAQDVARRLSIGQREPIDAASQELAGDATVVVVTGADRIQ